MEVEQTLPKLLAEQASIRGHEVALRQKDLGIWNEVTWRTYYEKVGQLAIALSTDYDFNQNDKLVIIGENRPQWLYSQLAAQVLGGISVGIYQESLPDQLIYYLNDCKARVVIVEDQEQVDKLLEIENHIPLVEHIIFYDEEGLRHYKHPKLSNFDDLLIVGESLLNEQKNFLSEQTERSLGNDIAIIAYSAATTGDPKGAMLTHRNLIAAAENLQAIDKMETNDDYLSFLPLAWIHEQVISVAMPLIKGSVINFPERPSTVLADLREIGPHTLLAPPRVYQTLMSHFETRIQGSSWLKKKIYKAFKTYGDKVAKAKLDKASISTWDRFMYKFGDWLVFSAIRDHFGLNRVKRAYIAGAALSTETFNFFHSIGLKLKQTYGGTELAGIAFVHRDEDIQIKSAGAPIPNTEVKIGEEGDIFVRNPAIFAHYLNEKDEKQVHDGWLSLGDTGYLSEDGHLNILDRKEDVIYADNGDFIYPSIIENNLKVSPYIQEVVTIGKDKPYMTAILNVDMTSVGRWADRNRITFTTYSDLATDPEVINLIELEVNKRMKELPENTRINRFVILNKQFNANDGELTRTLKIRRKYITKKYQNIITAMYSDVEEVTVEDEDREDTEGIDLQIIQLKKAEEVA